MTDHPSRLPDLILTAAVSDRQVVLGGIGAPAVLVFHGQDTADAALEVNKAVRRAHPAAGEVFIASVIDLRSIPSMFHGMVKPALEKAYFNAAGKVTAGADPADYVVLMPDWDGAAHEAVGISGATDLAAVVVADADGMIVRIAQGAGIAQAAVDALAGLTET